MIALAAIKTILGEAAGEPFEGQVAIGRVIRERARRRQLTVEEVCLQPKQFSFWNGGVEKAKAWLEKNTRPMDWDFAAQAWKESATGFENWATHYHAVEVRPYWAERMRRVGQVGRHVFYYE